MAIGKLIKGRGARGLMDYLLGDHDHSGHERPRADIIGGTFAGRTAQEVAAEFGRLHALRPRLGVHVAHMSLRFPPEERPLSDVEMAAIGEHWARGMSFEGFAVVCHGDHVHVAASRIRTDGSVVSDSQDWARSEALVRDIERRWSLVEVEASHLLEPEKAVQHRKAPTIAEIALAERGGTPLAEQMRDLLEAALHDAPTVSTFVERLEAHGVEVQPNLASTGRLNGFAYRFQDQEFTAKGLGRGFTLANMQKRGLTYEPHRDAPALDRCRARDAARLVDAGDGQAADLAGAGRGAPGQHQADAGAHQRGPVEGVASARPSDGRVDGGDPANLGAGGQPEQGWSRGGPGERENGLQGRGEAAREAGYPPPQHGAGRLGPERGEPVGGRQGEGRGMEGRPDGGPPVGPALRRLRSLAGLESRGAAAVDPTERQVRSQLKAMGCGAYEVGVLPPKSRRDLSAERTRTWTSEQILDALGWLRRMNALDRDIYIRPAPLPGDQAEPLVFVDDLTPAQAEAMERAGYGFAVKVESSPGRFHGWVRVNDQPISREEATAAAKALAREFGGDPHSADWRHYGRLCGFTNRKPERRTERGQPFALLRAASRAVATAGHALMDRVRQAIAERAEEARRRSEAIAQRQRLALPFGGSVAKLGSAADAFAQARARFHQVRDDGTPEHSARDFSACLALRRQGYSVEQISAAMKAGSPDLEQRHAKPDDYIRRTVERAEAFMDAARPGRGPRVR